jgi:hypothetical protein
MTPAQIIQALQLLEQGVSLVLDAGIAINEVVQDIQEARARGALLTDEQLHAYARRAADAVERL